MVVVLNSTVFELGPVFALLGRTGRVPTSTVMMLNIHLFEGDVVHIMESGAKHCLWGSLVVTLE